jgi:hypothetical protein
LKVSAPTESVFYEDVYKKTKYKLKRERAELFYLARKKKKYERRESYQNVLITIS